jgi:hypothetical protein
MGVRQASAMKQPPTPPTLLTAKQLCQQIPDLTVHKIKARRYNNDFIEGIHWYRIERCRPVLYNLEAIDHYWKWRHRPQVHRDFIESQNADLLNRAD